MIGNTNAIIGSIANNYVRPADWLNIPTMDGTTDDVYILFGVTPCDELNKIYFKVNGSGTISWGDGTTENFAVSSTTTFSHNYLYENISNSTWTEHNRSRQVLIHVTGIRGNISEFSTGGISYVYTNEDNVAVTRTSGASNIYQISGNVRSCLIGCSGGGIRHYHLELFDWSGNITNTSIENLFYYCYSLAQISELNFVNNISYARCAFEGCRSLKKIPEIDFSHIAGNGLISTFANCNSLIELPLIDCGTATSLNGTFAFCYSLKSIRLQNTTNVTNMNNTFKYCSALKNIVGLDTSNVTDMGSAFQYCSSLQTLPPINTRKITSMYYLFMDCSSLEWIPPLDTRNVTNFGAAFRGCLALKRVPYLNTQKAVDMSLMFYGCSNLQKVYPYDMSNLSNGSQMLDNSMLTSFKAFNLNPSKTGSLSITSLSSETLMTKKDLVDLFNSIAVNSGGYSRTIQIGSTLQGYLTNCYVKDTGESYSIKLPTNDTEIVLGKTYYTFNYETETFAVASNPDFTGNEIYFEELTATWNRYDICESTDTGAMLALDFARNIKGYTIS